MTPALKISPVPPEQAHHYRKWGISSKAHKAYVLESPIWAEKRRACKKRAGFKCEDCGGANLLLEAHHLTYEHWGAELPEELRALCQRCHARRHNGRWVKSEAKKRRKTLRAAGLLREAKKLVKAKEATSIKQAKELYEARIRCNQQRLRAARIAESKAFWSGKRKATA